MRVRRYKLNNRCRICGSRWLRKYVDLGKTPLANALLHRESLSLKESRYPLQVFFCEECSLSQLGITVEPELMFQDYFYHSSISKTFQKHCLRMAGRVRKLLPKRVKAPLVVDIASNDGCLLEQFKSQGYRVVGVEPAKNLVHAATLKGIDSVQDFWSQDAADAIIKKHGKADVITATNVFAHVDDLRDFLKAVSHCLKDSGMFIIEVPYLWNLLSRNQFDTIYHEHLSYFLVRPLKLLFFTCGLPIFHVEHYDIHGGSIRVYCSKKYYAEDKSVRLFERFERSKGLHDYQTYADYWKQVRRTKQDLVKLLERLRKKGKKVMAYGASAKGITLLNFCQLKTRHIQSIVDDTPKKQGTYVSGCRIPIVDRTYFDTEKPDYIALLAWNFSKELMEKTRSHQTRGGKYIVPIPKVEVV